MLDNEFCYSLTKYANVGLTDIHLSLVNVAFNVFMILLLGLVTTLCSHTFIKCFADAIIILYSKSFINVGSNAYMRILSKVSNSV